MILFLKKEIIVMQDLHQASYDLHLHSYWSYDACAPVEYYFKMARKLGLKAIAVTEHFTMDSFPEIMEISKEYPDVKFIPGVEMTVSPEGGGAIDMLCLGMPADPPKEIENIFEKYRRWQREIGSAFSAGMQKLGFDYSEEKRLELLKRYRPQKAIDKQGITHVQNGVKRKYFLDMGFISSEDAYVKLIEKLFSVVEIPPYPAASEVLPAFKRCGALVAIAHPTGYFNRDDIKRMDALREELGFEGIECAHDMVPPELTQFYRQYCLKHKLFSTAGSDNHADPDNNPFNIGAHHKMARHIGDPRWLEEILERLNLS
jgi:predicted metal-dependent phosphoesterase TrpH